MSRAAAIIDDLVRWGLTQGQICELTGIDRGHLSRIKQGLINPRAELTSVLERLRATHLGEISSAVCVLHYCVAGRRRISERERQAVAAAVYASLRRVAEMTPKAVSASTLAMDLPDGIDGVIVRLGKAPGMPIVALRDGLEPDQAARVILHEIKEYEKALRRSQVNGTPLSLPKAFKPSTEK